MSVASDQSFETATLAVPIIPNFTSNTNFTPSAVAIDKRGTMLVGEKAKRQALSDPKNAFSEFKLRMGIPKPYVFQDSGRELLPEELSAEVLKELKNSVFKQLNQDIDSVVITVPADFGPTKTLATNKAAKLAGFEYHPLIMEPVAAAYAYGKNASEDEEGIWLIYDLGGGTFDVSIVKLNDDEFEHVSHSGDEYLGGKLIDWDILRGHPVRLVVGVAGLDHAVGVDHCADQAAVLVSLVAARPQRARGLKPLIEFYSLYISCRFEVSWIFDIVAHWSI